MGCGSSRSTDVIAADDACDIIDPPSAPIKSPASDQIIATGDAGREGTANCDSSPNAENSAPAGHTGIGHDREEGDGVSSGLSPRLGKQGSPKSGQTSPPAEGTIPPRPNAARHDVPRTVTVSTAFDVALDDGNSNGTSLPHPRRLPKLDKLGKRPSKVSKQDIDQQAALHAQRRQEGLAKRSAAQSCKQSHRDKLRSEVRTARLLVERESENAAAKEKRDREEAEEMKQYRDMLEAMDCLDEEIETMPPDSEDEISWG